MANSRQQSLGCMSVLRSYFGGSSSKRQAPQSKQTPAPRWTDTRGSRIVQSTSVPAAIQEEATPILPSSTTNRSDRTKRRYSTTLDRWVTRIDKSKNQEPVTGGNAASATYNTPPTKSKSRRTSTWVTTQLTMPQNNDAKIDSPMDGFFTGTSMVVQDQGATSGKKRRTSSWFG